MTGLALLAPEFILAGLALLLMFADLFISAKSSRVFYHFTWIAAALTLGAVSGTLSGHGQGSGTLWVVDSLSQFFKMLVLTTTVLCALLSLESKELRDSSASGTFGVLLLFSAIGMMMLVSATDFLFIFVALELISISSFILTGFNRANRKSNEGAMKYFIFGAFSSAILAYGISLFYGATGTTSLAGLEPHSGPLFILALLLILLGFGFKASLAPMHFWVPDAYEGAPTPVTAFLSIAPKIATLGIIARIFSVIIPARENDLTFLFTAIAALTMTIGNFTAFFQNNVKRLLAYSSIAQAGYMLIGIVAGTGLGLRAMLVYSLVYVAMNIGAFALVQAVGDADSYELEAFDGLAQRSLGTALTMAFFLLALAGIPPLAGFIAKFYVFSSAAASGHWYLAVIAVINSVVSVYYYLRIVYSMFFKMPKVSTPLSLGPCLFGITTVAILAVLFFGLYPEPLVAGVRAATLALP